MGSMTPLRSQSFMLVSPPWPALIISGSLERYARAMLAARELGFTSVHVAAAYPPDKNASGAWRQVAGPCALDGYNGMRTAHRNAWRLLDLANVPMAVLEDDIIPIATSVDTVWAFLNRSVGYDVAFLNEVCGRTPWLSTAALWITPRAARQFLASTARCFPSAGPMKDIDHWTSKECFKRLRCLSAPSTVKARWRDLFGCGLFAQGRRVVEPWRGKAYERVG